MTAHPPARRQLCGRFFRNPDEPCMNRVSHGGDSYAMRQRLADAQQHALFAQTLFRRLVSQAADTGRRTLLPRKKRKRRSGGAQYPDRAKSPPRRAHYEKVLHPDFRPGGPHFHRNHRADQGHLHV